MSNEQPSGTEHRVITNNNQNASNKIGADRWIELGFTFAIMIATVVNVCIASRQWTTMTESNGINRETVVDSTRAWLIPTGAYFDGEPKAGFNVRLKLTYENIGKEAAGDAVPIIFWSPGTFPVKIDAKQMPYIDVQTAPWPIRNNAVCELDPTSFVNRRAVYPSSKNEFITYGFNDPPYLPEGVINGTEFFSIFGCIIYRSAVTGEKLHHSPFCLYYQPKRDGTIKDGTFEFCPSGSVNAD